MNTETWLYFVLAVLVLTASPGPTVLLCMTKAVTIGFRESMFTALGSLTAIVSIMTLSFTGLGVIIATSEIMFNCIKWFGVVYLIYLGYHALTSKQETYKICSQKGIPPITSKKSLYVSGFFVGGSNPKAIIFFTALFPQFINTSEPLLVQYIAFTMTFVFLELAWLTIYSYFAAKSSSWLLKKGRARLFNKITGCAFIGAGMLLSTSTKSSN